MEEADSHQKNLLRSANKKVNINKVMKYRLGLGLVLALLSITCAAQEDRYKAVLGEYTKKSLYMFRELIALPNDAHFPEDLEKNIRWCEDAFRSRQFSVKRLTTPGLPLLLASQYVQNATKTVLLYLQLDGQPVDSTRWEQASPWEATLKKKNVNGTWSTLPFSEIDKGLDPEWRIFARSASDAKGPVAAFLGAWDAMKASSHYPDYNIKVIMDFEEELGSPHLPDAVHQYRDELKADWLVILDGPLHTSNEPTLLLGARGACEFTLTTFGARVPLHSGHYGNYAPNPATRLSQLISSMIDTEGRVMVKGFYDGIHISRVDKKILEQVPDNPKVINEKIGIAAADKVGNSYQESLQYPSLNVRGLRSLYVGKEARTLVPDVAVAEFDIRLVPQSDPVKLLEAIRQHIEGEGYHLIQGTPTEDERKTYPRLAALDSRIAYKAFQTPVQSELVTWLTQVTKRATGKMPIIIRMTGGSIPISPFVATLGIPAVVVPTVNPDNNQHAENENIRVGNYVQAVKIFFDFLTNSAE